MKIIKTAFIAFVSINASFCQMIPADTLVGEYAGVYYYKSPPSNPWTITTDTFYVTSADSTICVIQANDLANSYGGNYYTNYYSCNGAEPSNYYMKFYFGDSMKWINDNVPQPPPNPLASMRFYGKRISNKTAGVNEQLLSEQVMMLPNPCNDVLSIESKKQIEKITITDLLGREMKNEKVQTEKTQIDVSELQEGIFFVQINTTAGVVAKKVVIQR